MEMVLFPSCVYISQTNHNFNAHDMLRRCAFLRVACLFSPDHMLFVPCNSSWLIEEHKFKIVWCQWKTFKKTLKLVQRYSNATYLCWCVWDFPFPSKRTSHQSVICTNLSLHFWIVILIKPYFSGISWVLLITCISSLSEQKSACKTILSPDWSLCYDTSKAAIGQRCWPDYVN